MGFKGFFKAFGFMFNAIKNKKSELLITIVMVLFLLFISSLVMFLLEFKAQPEAFSSIWATMWWGVAALTTVGYGDIYPVTVLGKLFGAIIAVLGVGLFALPAGIIASGFIEEIAKEKKRITLKAYEKKLKHAFFVEYFWPTMQIKEKLKIEHLPRKWLSLNDIQFKMGISTETVMEVIAYSKLFRLRNVKSDGAETVGLEYAGVNRSYGNFTDRKAGLTVVNLYSYIQPYFGHFSLVLADMLGANYISNEMFNKTSLLEEHQLNLIKHSDYVTGKDSHASLRDLKQDLKAKLGPGKTCVFLVSAASNDNLLQFNIGADKGALGFEKGRFFKDIEQLKPIHEKAVQLATSKEKKVLTHENNGKPDPEHVAWWIHKETDCNLLLLHVNVGILKEKTVGYYQYIREIADCLDA